MMAVRHSRIAANGRNGVEEPRLVVNETMLQVNWGVVRVDFDVWRRRNVEYLVLFVIF